MSNQAKNFYGILLVCLCVLLTGPAEAARMGGGKSFGSKPSYNAPYKRSADAAPSNPAPQQQQAPATAPNPAPNAPRSSGLMGMLGGLAIGGLLGSMLFGGGFHGVNLMHILLVAGLAFLAFKLLARRQTAQPAVGDRFMKDEASRNDGFSGAGTSGGAAGFDTDILSRKNGAAAYQSAAGVPAIPADFDTSAFLDGAKSAYRHLQSAWDQGDLAEIRGLATDRVFAEIQDQYRARSGDQRTEVLKLEAELLEVRDRENDREASVLFDVMMREDENERPKQVREVWHFVRSRLSRQPTWFLDGIQQLDD